jgi:hypothetical protein
MHIRHDYRRLYGLIGMVTYPRSFLRALVILGGSSLPQPEVSG